MIPTSYVNSNISRDFIFNLLMDMNHVLDYNMNSINHGLRRIDHKGIISVIAVSSRALDSRIDLMLLPIEHQWERDKSMANLQWLTIYRSSLRLKESRHQFTRVLQMLQVRVQLQYARVTLMMIKSRQRLRCISNGMLWMSSQQPQQLKVRCQCSNQLL